MKVKQVMYERPETINYHRLIGDVLDVYKRNQVNCAPVVNDDGNIVGILTVFRVLDAIKSGVSLNQKVADIMDTNLTSVYEDDFFEEVRKLPIERLLVMNENKKLVGVLTRLELINKVYNAFDATERELQVILQSIHNGIIAVDMEGRITHFNLAAQRMTGLSGKDAISKKLDVLFSGIDLGNMLETGVYKQRLGKSMVIIKGSSIKKEGKKLGTVFVIQDVSELEQISKELDSIKTQARELESIVESSSDGILVTDERGKILYENINFTSTLSSFDINYRRMDANNHISNTDKTLYELFLTAIKTKESLTKVHTHETGKELIIKITPIIEDKKVLRVIINLKDMTEINILRDEAIRNSQEIKALRALQFSNGDLIVQSPKMLKIINLAKKLAPVDSTVLITGESGVGKEVIAKEIHLNSNRKNEAFIQINCGAIPDSLLEAELFGYEKGAFTGADKEGKIGMLELANNGTLLLDEIGELPLNLQVKLLRAIQENEIYRLGGRKQIKLDVRIIAATNKDLDRMVKENKFREDLYYRLNVVPIYIPPLRERREDILPLAISFLNKINSKYNRKCKLCQEICFLFEQYSWPGNVRELKNIIERLIIMSEDEIISSSYLPESFGQRQNTSLETDSSNLDIMPLYIARENIEAILIKKAMEKYGSLRPASKALGISHSTLLRKARQQGIMVQN
ncbi:MAG: sigma 54-interacting transcriptional regulator [Clostridia bacterium]|nr:sigma 54-interacting transcriptional regulator [Clostridia bacterium]